MIAKGINVAKIEKREILKIMSWRTPTPRDEENRWRERNLKLLNRL